MAGNIITTVMNAYAAGERIIRENVVNDQDVYEVYKVVVGAASNVTVNMVTAVTNLLAIKASDYTLTTYKIHNSSGTPIVLDNMHMFNGYDMCAKLGTLDAIVLYNGSASPITVTILRARAK